MHRTCSVSLSSAEMFTKRDLEGQTKGQWYLRQMLGSSNIDAGPVMAFMTGNLSYQIEHHLYRICRAPAGRDLGAGASGVRQIRPALHHGFAAGAVRQGVADNRQAVVAEQVPVRPGRRRPGKPAARRCSPSSSRHSSGPTRQPARVEDRDGDGAAVAAALRITPLRLRAFTLGESLDLAVPTNSPEFVGKTPSGWERVAGEELRRVSRLGAAAGFAQRLK